MNFAPWERLINFLPPQKVREDLRARVINREVQPIEDARAWRINLDYYPILVKALPALDGVDAAGRQWMSRRVSGRATASEFLRHIRVNINDFVDTTKCRFTPVSSWDSDAWRGTLGPSDKPFGYDPPVGSVISISMKDLAGWIKVDRGSVVCAESDDSHWIFSTVFDWILDWHHPVSGNREFGYFLNSVAESPAHGAKFGTVEQNNEYALATHTFYTKGADAATTIADAIAYKLAYGKGHALWLTLQDKVKEFVNGHGGSAEVLPPLRSPDGYAWSDVRESIFHGRAQS